MNKKACLLAGILGLGLSPLSFAATIAWTDWTSGSAAGGTGAGSLLAGATTVGVSYSGPAFGFIQTGSGTNYFSPTTPYVSAQVSNAPPASEIIALTTGGVSTITFSQPILNPYLALVSWNSNTVDFNTPIEVVSFGAGYWGSGTPIVNAAGDGFFGSGEVHGVIRLPGTFSSISFSHTSESWHGFTIGVLGLADGPPPPTGVPEPSTLVLMLAGLLGMGMARRRARQVIPR